MVRNLLRKLLGQSEELPPSIADAVAELERLIHERPAWARPASILRDALPVMYAEVIRAEAPSLSLEQARSKLAAGVPLLRGESLTFDRDGFRRRWLQLCVVLRSQAADQLSEAVTRGRFDPAELLRCLLTGSPQEVHGRVQAAGCDADLATIVLRLAAFPLLSELSEVLIYRFAPPRETINRHWEHGYCPTCGSGPLLAELRGLEQILYLRCGWCASEWQFPRLQCPHCGTRDHHQLGYLHAEGLEEKERVAVCDHCRGCVKVVATLAALAPIQLLAADVKTAYLDLLAAEQNYTMCPQ